MHPDAASVVQACFDDDIPLTRAMGLRVESLGEGGIRMNAPLEPNVNDKGTAFGGSLAAILTLAGWGAKIGGLVHWVVYGALAWGIWFMRPWAWWLGSLYATRVAIAMFAWPILQNVEGGLTGSIVAGLVFAIPAVAFWRSRSLFEPAPAEARE